MSRIVHIEYKGVSYVFEQKDNQGICYDKYWFIIKNSHVPNIENIAEIWMCKQNGMTYPPHIKALLTKFSTF
jgi:hypothetical protein